MSLHHSSLWLKWLRSALMVGCLILFSSCSSLREATSSQQWISVDITTNNIEAVMIHERALASGDISAAIMSTYALGTVKAFGPADITRTIEYNPSNGALHVSLQTDNSEWLGGLFRGLWSSATVLGDWITTVTSGAKP